MCDLTTVPITKSWPRSRADYIGIFHPLLSPGELQGLQMRGVCDTERSQGVFSHLGDEAVEPEADSRRSAPAPPRTHPSEVSQGPRGQQTQRHGTERGQGLCSASLGLSFPICKSGSCYFFLEDSSLFPKPLMGLLQDSHRLSGTPSSPRADVHASLQTRQRKAE